MTEKINIAEILKYCPKGMELDCTMFRGLEFVRIDEYNKPYPIICRVKTAFGSYNVHTFTEHGSYGTEMYSKCVIFPKGKTTWEGFVPPYKFKDGDIVATTNGLWIGITTGGEKGKFIPTYCVIRSGDEFKAYPDRKGEWAFNRLATKKEKEKLFQVIKDNGYKWNPETKTLENLVEPWTIQYAKDGDVLAFDDETIVIFKDLYNNTSFHSYCHIEDGIFTISKKDMPDWWRAKGFYPATEEQCTLLFRKIKEAGYHWNAETKTLKKLPKFKVGDKIKYKNGKNIDGVEQGVILSITDEVYDVIVTNNMGICVSIAEQDDWELVPDKFDINNLKPLQPVLVRDTNGQVWTTDLFSHKIDTNKRLRIPFVCVGHYANQCIPYEGNEHLLGTTDNCAEFYKTW